MGVWRQSSRWDATALSAACDVGKSMFKEMGELERMKAGRNDPPISYNQLSRRGIVPVDPNVTEAEIIAAMEELRAARGVNKLMLQSAREDMSWPFVSDWLKKRKQCKPVPPG